MIRDQIEFGHEGEFQIGTEGTRGSQMITEYFELLDDLELKDRWHLCRIFDATDAELDSRDFQYGIPLAINEPLRVHLWNSDRIIEVKQPMKLTLSKNGLPLDFTFTDSDMPVVTTEVANILWRIASNDIQRFPIELDGISSQFEIINVSSRINCIDTIKSEIQWWEVGNDIRPDLASTPEMITKLVIDPTLTQGSQIFRLQGWGVKIIISTAVKNAFEEMCVSGVKYKNICSS